MANATYSELFVQNMRTARASGYSEIRNLVQRQATLAGYFMAREEMDATVKGSPEEWSLLTQATGTTQRRNPKDPLVISRDHKALRAKVALRIFATPLPMVEWEHDMAEVDENRFASLVESEFAAQVTDHINEIDDNLLAPPDTEMENTAAQDAPMHSLPTLLCPDTNGLPSGFTTIMGVAPSSVPNSKWRPVVRKYSDAFDVDAGAVEALCAAFDRVKFDRIARSMAARAAQRETTPAECGIISGYAGKSLIRRYNARNNDQHGLELAKDGSTIRGIPLVCVSEMDNKNLDYRSSYTTPYPTDEPVFFLPNLKDLHLIAHRKHFFRHVTKDMGARQYDVDVDILETWINLRCYRRDTSAVVAPE